MLISDWYRWKAAWLRHFWHESLPWAIAWMLPRRIALFAFVRVYSTLGYCTEDYNRACNNWEAGIGK